AADQSRASRRAVEPELRPEGLVDDMGRLVDRRRPARQRSGGRKRDCAPDDRHDAEPPHPGHLLPPSLTPSVLACCTRKPVATGEPGGLRERNGGAPVIRTRAPRFHAPP